jgi:hypothetical protein
MSILVTEFESSFVSGSTLSDFCAGDLSEKE